MGTAIKHPVPEQVKPSFIILTSGHYDTRPWAQSAQMSNYNWVDSLTQSGTGCFVAVSIWQQCGQERVNIIVFQKKYLESHGRVMMRRLIAWLYSGAVPLVCRILVERILNTSLVPFSLDAVERMKRLYTLYANLDEHAIKWVISQIHTRRQKMQTMWSWR